MTSVLDPQSLITTVGLIGILAIVFAESGLLIGFFLPVTRCCSPPGASRMDYRSFLVFNIIGGALWSCGVTTLGYFLGQVTFVRSNIEVILVGIVAVSLIPVAIELLRARRRVQTPTR